MSEYIPITTDLRLLIGCFTTKLTDFERDKFNQLCDALDSIHANLERENERLRECDGWVELPKDADGEYIHIGDVMECEKLPNGNRVCGEVKGIGDGYVWLMNVQYKIRAEYLRHHTPTVEDVLREMLDAWGELPSNATNDAIVAEYAKRLTLAGDAE